MNETLAAAGFTQDTFDRFLTTRDEPAWLTDLRSSAFETFERLPMPDSSHEEWRRTDIRLLRLDQFQPPGGEAPQSQEVPPALLSEGVALGGHAVSLDSCSLQSQLDPELQKKGVLFGCLDALVAEHSDLLRPHLLARAVDPNYDKFAAMHAAFFCGGALLYVPRGVEIEQPLHTLAALSDGASDFSHTLVVLEEGASATLLAETAGGGASLHCGAVELLLGPGASLRYVNLQNWEPSVWHFAHHKALLDRGARLQWTIGALGGRLAKVNQHVALTGEGAQAQVNGVMFAEGRQHLAYHTLQHHEAPGCKSDLLYKGALQDHSRIIWRGMIKVDPGADKTDGYQRNDNLMLAEHARVDSIPGLEIEADDVICTHGATAGRVDDELIFYARCRGLTRKEAVRMIVAGFFQQVFDRITIDSVREALGQAIGRRIREYD